MIHATILVVPHTVTIPALAPSTKPYASAPDTSARCHTVGIFTMPRVVINSKYRVDGTQEAYTYRIWTPIKNVRFIRLVSGTVPRSTFPITTGYNDTFEYNDGAPKTAVIPPGNYSGTDLAAAITTLIGFTVTFDTVTGRLSWDGSGALASVGPFVITPAVHHALGWPLAGSGALTAVTLSTNVSVLNWPDHLFLNISTNSSYGSSTYSTTTAHTFVIPMQDTMFGEYAAYNEHERFSQVDTVSDKDLIELNITWYPPDDRAPGSQSATAATNFSNARQYFSFNGVDHQLVLDLVE